MIVKHYCLDGEQRLGEEFDCPKCRVLMLEAFRPDVRPVTIQAEVS